MSTLREVTSEEFFGERTGTVATLLVLTLPDGTRADTRRFIQRDTAEKYAAAAQAASTKPLTATYSTTAI